MTYQPLKQACNVNLLVNGVTLNIVEWGDPAQETLFLCHGWMDVAQSWQFVADALSDSWHIVALDWRGFGLSEKPSYSYFFPQYLADIEAVFDHYSPNTPVNVVGHSMGANILGLYAGIRPERVSTFINLDGFGLPSTELSSVASRYAGWLDSLKTPPRLRSYPDFETLANKLARDNKQLSAERADFIARHWAKQQNGEVVLHGDPRHKSPNPTPYRREETLEIWSKITARCCWVGGVNSPFTMMKDSQRKSGEEYRPEYEVVLEDSGHMLHLEQPEKVAEIIEAFINNQLGQV